MTRSAASTYATTESSAKARPCARRQGIPAVSNPPSSAWPVWSVRSRIATGPEIDRLLVVTDGEHVAMSVDQLANHAILDRIQVLKLVHQHATPAGADLGDDLWRTDEEIGRLEYEHVEVDDVAFGEEGL